MTKRSSDPAGSDEGGALVHGSRKRAFLVTMHDTGADAGAPFVAVQASHSNGSHRFTDLANAFGYLESRDRRSKTERDEDIAGDD